MNTVSSFSSAGLGKTTADASAPVRVAVRNLDFYYGDARALRGVDLDFHDRQVTALIGPSGCGKSTLLRVFNRIYSLYPEQRASGEVILDGRNILSPSIDVNEPSGTVTDSPSTTTRSSYASRRPAAARRSPSGAPVDRLLRTSVLTPLPSATPARGASPGRRHPAQR